MPRPRALWLQLRNVPILRMLQLEEALFRTDRRSWFITNEWDSAQPAAEALVLASRADRSRCCTSRRRSAAASQ